MQTASFTGLLKAILYFFAFYYIFKFLAKLFLPVLVKKVVEKAGEKFQNQYNASDDSWGRSQNNTEIKFDKSNTKNPRGTKIVGDYVDYEEID
jgi:hypothetical protein